MSSELARRIRERKDALLDEASELDAGRRGRVLTARVCGVCVAIKVSREDVNIPAFTENEGKYNEVANEVGVGPELYYYDADMVVREHVQGFRFGDWARCRSLLDGQTESVLCEVFDQCFRLDQRGLHRPELSRPKKDILVSADGPVIIDFERCRFDEQPANVLGFAECVLGEGYADWFGVDDRNEVKRRLRPVFKAYKSSREEAVKRRIVRAILGVIG
jgi:predicted Ser/Thr protein kinase